MSKARLSLAFVPYGVVGVVHVAALAAIALGVDASALVTATKPLLMPLLLLGFLLGVPAWRAGAARLGGAAIVLSWVGDVALMFPGDTAFLAGLGAFLAAHVCFVLLISRHLTLRRLPLASLASWVVDRSGGPSGAARGVARVASRRVWRGARSHGGVRDASAGRGGGGRAASCQRGARGVAVRAGHHDLAV